MLQLACWNCKEEVHSVKICTLIPFPAIRALDERQ